MKKAFLNVGYTLLSNATSLVISALITFIVPKMLGVENYGYLQLYFFYCSYTGFLHFGWADGIFLRYGGEYYDNLDKSKISGQFWFYSATEIIIGILVAIVGYMIVPAQEKATIMVLLGLSIILLLPKTLLQYLLQCTNRIKEYASLTILERIVYAITVICVLAMGYSSYQPIIYADLLGKAVTLVWAVYKCKGIIITKPPKIVFVLREAAANISVGAKLMISNIASMLIIGIIRMSIENQWSIETFGKVSLTMAISNLLMIFIGAVSLVMFPLLRRTNADKLSSIYSTLRLCLMVPLLGLLVLYYPAKIVLSAWLPQYAESLKYMAILFPMCVFESKMSMLVSTYMKALRLEKTLLFVNIVTLMLSVISTAVVVFWLHNLDLAILLIVVLLAIRCILAELLLSQSLDVMVKKDIFLEAMLTATFIFSSWVLGGIKGIVVYIIAYIVYLVLQRKQISAFVRTLVKMLDEFKNKKHKA